MKKILISIAVLGALSSAAQAQTNVTIFGILDAGVVVERGGKAGNITKVGSGVSSASRLGFKGTEDLGGGLSAVFMLEGGIKGDTGESDVAGSIANRQAYVGLVSKEAGSLTLGRQYTPLYNAFVQVADPFAAGLAGSAKNLFSASGSNVRISNAVNYATPVYNGFSGELQYGAGEQSKADAGRSLGASLAYKNGPLNARVVYNNRNNDTNTAGLPVVNRDYARSTLFAANYDFSVAKGYVAYAIDKGPTSSPIPNPTAFTATAVAASTDSDTLLVGATVPVQGTAGTVIASYIHKDDNNVANRDANQWALGYTYALSKRTNTYVAYAKIKNKRGASYTVGNNAEAGSGDKAFNVGVKHSF